MNPVLRWWERPNSLTSALASVVFPVPDTPPRRMTRGPSV